MFSLGYPELIIVTVILLFMVVPAWLGARVARKAGFSRAWALALLLLPLHAVLIWIFAFVPWPALERTNSDGSSTVGLRPQCPRCATAYDLNDYRSDVATIYCSQCGGELPRGKAP
jgi:hypothetical protein